MLKPGVLCTPKKVISEDSNSSDKLQPLTETPRAPTSKPLRLILKFEGPDEQNGVPNKKSNNQEPKEESQADGEQTMKKKKKKKKKNKDKKDYDKKQTESMYIVLDSSESSSKETQAQPAGVATGGPVTRKADLTLERQLPNVPLRQRHNRSPLQRLLDYAIQQLEDKDTMQVFAWPVTDQIAPGYSKVIKVPMDFSTMRQKINDNAYPNYKSFVDDFELMCNNAMTYNRPDTMYYKAAKRLLHSGTKFLSVDKVRQLASSFTVIKLIPPEQLGFDWETGSPVEMHVEQVEEPPPPPPPEPEKVEKEPKKRSHNELTAEEALELAKQSACTYDERQFLKRRKTTFSMGFLRQRQDGSTSLAIFVPGDGVNPEKPSERVVTIGQLVGKLNQGTGTLQGFREHRRNIAKAIKPLTYGPFGSYAPSYDSTFANLSKYESDLVYGTYGDESPSYIENVLSMAKVSDYTLTMVDNLLDVVSGGEYRKSKAVMDDRKKFQEEEERVRNLIEKGNTTTSSNQNNLANVKVEIEQLKTLSELGIDTSFLEHLSTTEQKENTSTDGGVQNALSFTSKLIEKLHQIQNERLSAPPPPHLSQISQPSDLEVKLAHKIVETLTSITKTVPPGAIIPVPAIRKAMGVVSDSADSNTNVETSIQQVSNAAKEALKKNPTMIELDSDLKDILENGSSTCTFEIQEDKITDEEMVIDA